MVTVDFLDGNVADWNSAKDDRCLCDIEATIVYRLAMGRSEFDDGLRRLDRRRAARAEFVGRRLTAGRLVTGLGLGLVDADRTFELNDEFEEMFGREPLEAFVTDTEEVVHRCLGEFFRSVYSVGAVTSPMSAGRAFTIRPGRSFQTASALLSHSRGSRRAKWVPSVRTELSFVVAGDLADILAVVSGFPQALSECGVMTRFEQSMRKPDLAGIPYARPFLAEVGGNGAGEVKQM